MRVASILHLKVLEEDTETMGGRDELVNMRGLDLTAALPTVCNCFDSSAILPLHFCNYFLILYFLFWGNIFSELATATAPLDFTAVITYCYMVIYSFCPLFFPRTNTS